jgi:hypothetical protein
VSFGAALIWSGLLAIGLGVVLLFKHEGEIGLTDVRFVKTRNAGVAMMVFGFFFLVPGLAAWNGNPTSSSNAPSTPERGETTAPERPVPPRREPRQRAEPTDCCATSCKNGVSCVPCNVGLVPWQVRVSGAGYMKRGEATIDLADSKIYSNVEICIGDTVSNHAGCVPLTQAVRRGGALVAELQGLSKQGLEDSGLHVIVKAERNGVIEQLTSFTRKLEVSPRNVCSGYILSAPGGGYFAALFLVDASPG